MVSIIKQDEVFDLILSLRFFGVGIEVFFTSIHDYIKTRDIAFRGRSYLWMFSIYGVLGIIIWPLYNSLIKVPFILRGLIYMAVIFAGEFIYGYLLNLKL